MKTYSRYITDYYNIKQYNDDMYKLTYCKKPIKRAGFEDKNNIKRSRDVNDVKLSNNVARARAMVFEYALCNDFEYFVTLTLNKDLQDRYDLKGYIKRLGQFIRNYRRDHGADIQYLLIPEKHRDGAWHMHGLFKGIPAEHLSINENGYMDWKAYSKKFGFISLDKIKNKEACSKYITKYVSKSFDKERGVTEKESKLYYCSRGLKRAKKKRDGTLSRYQLERIPFSFENDYVKTGFFTSQQYKWVSEILDNYIIS